MTMIETPKVTPPYSSGVYSLPADAAAVRTLFLKRLNKSVFYARFYLFICLCFEKGSSPTLRQVSNVLNVSPSTRRIIYVMMERLELIKSTMVKVYLNEGDRFKSAEIVLVKGSRFDEDALQYAVIAAQTLKRHRARHAE